MVVPPHLGWLRTIFYWGTATHSRIAWRWTFVTALAGLTTFLDLAYGYHVNLTPTPFTLVGLALSIFLGFRNTASYDRWWEGRKLWGSLVNTARSAARQYQELVGPVPARDGGGADSFSEAELRDVRKRLVYAVAGYTHALRLHLRSQDHPEELAPFFPKETLDSFASRRNRPAAILEHIAKEHRVLWERGLIHAYHVPKLEDTLEKLTDIQGGCERILKTPVPFAYTVLLHRIVAVYCVALPFGLVEALGGVTPVVVGFIAYAFFGLDSLGEHMEEPFGTDPEDLPLDQLSRMIENNLRQTLGETDLPPEIVPDKRHVLS